jgi:hypothetical protein
MLEKLENQPIITLEEARHVVHTNKWFWYVVIERTPRGRPDWEEKVRVLFIADTENEIRSVPNEQFDKIGYPGAGLYWGSKVDPEQGCKIAEDIEVDWLPTGK